MRILGIDPGLRKTGFGVIQIQGSKLSYIASGTIVVPPNLPMAERLGMIFDNLCEVANDAKPDVSAIEKVFLNTNPATTLLLGQARGAALCALANSKLAVHEYTALQIKKSVTGTGHASKEQIQIMVKQLLSLGGEPAADAADALACAICHAHCAPLAQRLQQLNTSGPRTGRIKSGRFIK